MGSVANTYLNKIDCGVQECVYRVLPERWFERTFPRVISANRNVSEKRFCIFLSKNEIIDLSEDSEDIFKRNMIDRYIDSPNIASFGGKGSILDSFCYAEYLRFYYLASKTKLAHNDYQPEELSNELIEHIHNIEHIYSKVIPLM